MIHGVWEPLFGVTTELPTLYATGNYAAAYLAGMIAEPEKMQKANFETWMETAYCCRNVLVARRPSG